MKAVAIGACIALVGLLGCGGKADSTETAQPRIEQEPPQQVERSGFTGGSVASARCPAELDGCRTTTGRIVYVEAVDPDWDGDAHFVVVDPQGISLPGLTAIDVRRGLRPEPLPGVGDLISAAGPVQTGSYGQDQIHAVELRVAGR